MNKNDYDKFASCLIGCAEITGKTLSDHAIALYWHALKQLEIEVIIDAFNRHIKNPDQGQFMPKPADIIRLCNGSHIDSAMSAWTLVHAAMRTVGRYESVVFSDTATMATIADMGGWIFLCGVTEEELPFKSKEFQTRYKAYLTIGRNDCPSKLIGVSESSNASSNQPIQPPVFIGNLSKAQLIFEGKNGGENPVLQAIHNAGQAPALP